MLYLKKIVFAPAFLAQATFDAYGKDDTVADDKTNTFLPWFPARTVADARALVRRFIAEEAKGVAVHRAICLAGEPIGYIHADCGESHDLGYALRRDLWGRGFATEAGFAFIDALKRVGFPFVTATHDVNNPASGAVMKKLGFSYRYSYREQWQPKNISVVFRMFQLDFDGSAETYRGYWDKYPEHWEEKIDG